MKSALPAYKAQLATLVDEAPTGDAWLHELKYDGYRIGCAIERGKVRLESRRGNDWTAQFPEVVAAAERLPVERALLDGEVAVVSDSGQTSFQALQNAFSGSAREGLTYFVFDLLHLDGKNLAAAPLVERKRELERLLRRVKAPTLKYSAHIEGDGPEVFARACKLGAEGIVSKRRDQPYRPGRNSAWLKIKCVQRQEFVVGGFTDPEGSRQGIGALLIGYYDSKKQLIFAGKVGTGRGFTAKFTSELRADLNKLEQRESPFTPVPPKSAVQRAHWVRPERVVEVAFAEWTQGGNVRHGSVLGLRSDKRAHEVRRERPRGPRGSLR